MSPTLIDRMPRRRWIDWASACLGPGWARAIFLIEFYYQLLCGLTNKEDAQSVADKALGKHRGFFQWNSTLAFHLEMCPRSRDCVSVGHLVAS